MDLGLKGKIALITGGSKGIGYATALLLASEGAEVAIIARNLDPLTKAASAIKEKIGKEVFTVCADVASEKDAQRVVAEVVDHFGGVDILVNNAGTSAAGHFQDVGADAWIQDLDLKVMGAVHYAREVLPHMRKAGGGSIVNVTAIVGKTPSSYSLPTSVSRAAGLALTKAMSKDLAGDHIRVNAVCIGLIRSDQIERKWQNTAPELSWEQFSTDTRHDIPLGRIGEAEEAAKVIAFLVSEASSYVTGTSINIDGGKSAVL